MMNVINGGAHADNAVDVQEFMLVPLGFEKFSDALRAGVETFHQLKKVLKGKKLNTAVGDEGGFAPDLKSNAAAIELIIEAIQQAGYKPGQQIAIALDPAATEFYDAKRRCIRSTAATSIPPRWWIFWAGWVEKYPIVSIEDGCSEDDWDGWKLLTQRLGEQRAAGRRRYFRDQHQATAARHRRAAWPTAS